MHACLWFWLTCAWQQLYINRVGMFIYANQILILPVSSGDGQGGDKENGGDGEGSPGGDGGKCCNYLIAYIPI